MATQHAYTRHLGPWVIVFVVGAVIVTPATWFYPRPIAIVFMWIGAVLASLSMVVVFINGLIWEPVVGVCVLLTFEAASVYLSALWWPLRHFSSADRRAALLRLRKLPYRERRRVMWSRRYDQLLSEE